MSDDEPAGSPVDPAAPANTTIVTPGADVPLLRREARAFLGDGDTPMVEIDARGRIIHVGGNWQSISAHTKPGSGALRLLFEKVDDVVAVRDAIESTLTGSGGAVFARADEDHPYLSVVPTPSAVVAGRVHALVGITDHAEVAPPLRHSEARYDITPDDAAAVEARRRAVAAATEAMPLGERTATAALLLGDDRPATSATPNDGFVPGVPGAAVGESGPSGDSTVEPAPTLGERLARLRRDGPTPAAQLVGDDDFESVAEADRAAYTATDATRPQATLVDRLQLAGIALALYVAFQGLYLGPAYGWPSPLNGMLESGACLVEPLCNNRVLLANHLGVIALLVAVALLVVRFRKDRPSIVTGSRPVTPAPLRGDTLDRTLAGPWPFLVVAGLALFVMSAQTLLGGSPSHWPWLVAIGSGAVAAWRADRDGGHPLGATMAALTFGIGLLLTVLGVGGLWLGDRRLLAAGLLLVGLAGLVRAVRLAEAGESTFDRIDWLAMIGLSLLALVLGLVRHRSWRYAFVGDEWTFYEGAFARLRGNTTIDTFDIGGPNDYFTGLTFELQATVMRVGGADVFGWRLSALLPMVLSVPAMYAFTRWLAGRAAAMAAGTALAAAHMLLSFSMVPYNNSQSLVAVSASFAALAWAHQRPSALRFFVLGAAVGSTFVVYAMARLALLPIAALFLVLFRDDLVALRRRLLWSTLGGLAVAAPALFSWRNWEALLKATPVEAEANVRESGVLRQLFENTFGGWLSFIASDRNSHYIVGPHLDVLSALLVVVGLAWAVVRAWQDRAVRWFLLGGVGLWTAINAVQQYAQISNTRSFMIPLVYCVFVGLGVHALVTRNRGELPSPRPLTIALGLLGVLLVGVNQWHISGHANERQGLTEQALLIRQFEETEGVDGQGMPVHVAWPEDANARLTMILRAHEIAPERMVIVPTDGELAVERLCAATEPAMAVLHRAHPRLDEWRGALEACWGSPGVEVFDPAGGLKVIRLTNADGSAEFDRAASDRFRTGTRAAIADVRDVVDLAVDGDGTAFALTRGRDGSPGAIHRLDDGSSFELAQQVTVDFDITASGHFVVAGAAGDDRLVWYDGDGNRVARYAGRDELAVVGGLAVDGDRLWVTDAARGRVFAFGPNTEALELLETRSAAGGLLEPAAVVPALDGGIWVHSAGAGEIVYIDAADESTARVAAPVIGAIDAPRLGSADGGLLVQPLPEYPAIRLVGRDGAVIDEIGGITRPVAAAINADGVLTSDARWHEQRSVATGPAWSPSWATGVVRWGQAMPLGAGTVEYASPFGGAGAAPGAIPIDVEPSERVEIEAGRTWREIGVAVLGPVHAIDVNGDQSMVADTSGRLVRLDATGAALEVIGVGGGTSFISDLVIADDGSAWVLDAGAAQLYRVAPDNTVVSHAAAGAALGSARGIGLARPDGLWVATTAGASITRLDADGALVVVVPVPGRQPTDVVETPDGSLWFVDAEQLELVHVDQSGTELDVIPLDGFSSVEAPHLAVDDDTVWMSHPETSLVLAVDIASAQLRAFTGALARPAGDRVDKAIGIAVGDDGTLWVVDSNAAAVLTLGG